MSGLLAIDLRVRCCTRSYTKPWERWVFVGPDGKGLDYANWRTPVWRPAVARCELTGLRFHDLRVRHEAPCIRVG